MAKTKVKKTKQPKEKTKKEKKKRKPNWLLRITVVVIAVPVIILAVILLLSLRDSDTPVTGSRFDDELDPAITEEDLTSLEEALVYDNVDSIEINLISATLRINVDVSDDMGKDSIKSLAKQIYDQVDELLPIETYFTNTDETKMYDLEINVYNYIPDDDDDDDSNDSDGQIWYILHKNASEEEYGTDTPTDVKNEEVVESMTESSDDDDDDE